MAIATRRYQNYVNGRFVDAQGGKTLAVENPATGAAVSDVPDSSVEDARGASARLDRSVEVVLLRCAQEALSNVRKHANAASAAVRLTDAVGGAELTIADDGVGLASAASELEESGFGLRGMRERVSLVGGTFSVATDHGTVVRVLVPTEATA